MEFCPEFAVFQSALQLIKRQTDDTLHTITRQKSRQFMNIIQTAVGEICQGLEQANNQEDLDAWNQKLHLMCLYSVIENYYREPVEKTPGRVPMCSSLDMLSKMLPKFSPQFYFEMLVTCSWTPFFVECLEYIDRENASCILCEFLKDSQDDPVVHNNTEVIAMVTDKILSSCLCLPLSIETTVLTLLRPTKTERKYIQVLFPDTESGDGTETEQDKKGSEKCGPELNEKTDSELPLDDGISYVGATFWDYFVDANTDIVNQMLDNFDKCLENKEALEAENNSTDILKKDISNDGTVDGGLDTIVGRIILFWYVHVAGGESKEDTNLDMWFINNVYISNQDIALEERPRERLLVSYRLNIGLVEKLARMEYREKILKIVNRCVILFVKYFCNGTKNREIQSSNDICMLKTKEETLMVKHASLMRMVQATLTDLSGNEMEPSFRDDLTTQLEGQGQVGMDPVLLSDHWSRDVTLDALLWRIGNQLYGWENCLQTLLSDNCWPFWRSSSIYEVFLLSPNLVSKTSHLQTCIQILCFLLKAPPCSTVSKMREVLVTSFTEMSLPDRDVVVSGIYQDVAMDTNWLLGNMESQSVHLQITNTFNKVTADMNQQVVNEVFQHTLRDPVSVIKAALEMCIKNEDQAANFAHVRHLFIQCLAHHNKSMILCNLPVTCNTKHPLKHPDTSLLLTVIDSFVRHTGFSEKEEKHFVMFMTKLMRRHTKEQSSVVLSPTDLVNPSYLEAIEYNNILSSCHPIKCTFALTVLTAALECGRNSACDWSKCDFEPVVLLLNLAGILHECSDIWSSEYDKNDTMTSGEGQVDDIAVAMVMGHQKIFLKEKVLSAMELLVNMMLEGYLAMPDNETIYWFMSATETFNLTVQVMLANFLFRLGYIQPMSDLSLVYEEMMTNIGANLPTVLLLACTDVRFVDTLDQTEVIDVIGYDDLVAALVQLVPNLLADELQRVILITEKLTNRNRVPVCYRSTSRCAVPITDLSSIQHLLYTSQIYRDTILTLTYIQGERSSMLKHVLQTYVSTMKVKCNQVFETDELCVFTLTQVFHHLCDLVELLPKQCVDSGLVFLLHLLTKVKDISTATPKRKVKASKEKFERSGSVGKLNLKLVKNLENGMLTSVGRLSDNFEEKHMLLKKLKGPDL